MSPKQQCLKLAESLDVDIVCGGEPFEICATLKSGRRFRGGLIELVCQRWDRESAADAWRDMTERLLAELPSNSA